MIRFVEELTLSATPAAPGGTAGWLALGALAVVGALLLREIRDRRG